MKPGERWALRGYQIRSDSGKGQHIATYMTDEDDGRVLAAAPALLEALEAMLPFLSDQEQLLDNASLNDGRAHEWDMVSVKAREAIAAAREKTKLQQARPA